MAATTTSYVACLPHAWSLIADGASVASCQLQADGAIDIAVAASAPATTSIDCVTLHSWPPLSLTLATGDKVYGRRRGAQLAGVRIIQTASA